MMTSTFLRTLRSPSLSRPFSRPFSSFSLSETNGDVIYTSQHWEMRKSLRAFIDKEINPHVDQWEKEGNFPAKTLFKAMGDQGFLGVCRPVEYGGLGLDFTYSIAMAEEMGNVNCAAIPMAVGVQTDMATPALAAFGSDYLKEEFLKPAISGDAVASIAVSEVSGGSDVASVKTSATKDGDDLIINGSKMWITNAKHADWICVLVNTSRPGEGASKSPYDCKSLVIVPASTPGFKVASQIKKMGNLASDTNELIFDNVRVPARNIVGKEGMGFIYQMLQFQEERLYVAASTLQGVENLINSTMEYTSQRKVFGKPIIHHQAVQFKIAEMQADVELLRSLIYRAGRLYAHLQEQQKQGQKVSLDEVTRLASIAKLEAGRLARRVTDGCLQYWGGMGYTEETPVSRAYRDFRVVSIAGGADEVMLNILCKMNGSLPKK